MIAKGRVEVVVGSDFVVVVVVARDVVVDVEASW